MSGPRENRDLGPLVSRVLPVQDRAWIGVVYQAGKPVLDSEQNLGQEIEEYSSAAQKRLEVYSGVYIGDDSPVAQPAFYTTRGIHFDSAGKPFEIMRANEFAMDPFIAIINGYLVDVHTSLVNGGELDGRFVAIKMPEAPLTGSRVDLVFLEAFFVLIDPVADTETKPSVEKIFRDGNRQFKYPEENPNHEMIDPYGRVETTKRIQLQYRIRIVTDVDVDSYPDGLGDPSVMGWGAISENDSAEYPFIQVWPGACDYGLYVAGDGGLDCRNLLGTVDGFTYAIPLYAIHRRNRNPYNVHCNPNGSLGSIENLVKSDRPDCLMHDEVAERDVLPLYHAIAPQGLNFEELGSNAFDRLVRGWLKTYWRAEWTRTAKGTTLLAVDGITNQQQQGVFQIAGPDGFRDKFSDSSCDTVIKDTFKSDTDKNTVILSYIANCHRVALTAPVQPTGTKICDVVPKMYWQDTGEAVVLVTPWTNLGTGAAYAEIDPSAPTFEASGDIVIIYYVCYGKGNGLEYSPIALYRFVNELSPSNIIPYGFGFVGSDCPRPICECDDIDVTMDHWQDMTPCNYDDIPAREYRGSFNGNGTDKVIIAACAPCEGFTGDYVRICSCDEKSFPYKLVGFHEFKLVSAKNMPVMPVKSIIRAGENSYEVTFCRPILTTEVLSFRAITTARVGGFDPHCRGLMYVSEPTLFTQDIVTPAGGFYTYKWVGNRPIARNLFRTTFGVDAQVKPFMYVFGVATPIYDYNFIDEFTVVVRVAEADHPTCTPGTALTVCPCISTKAEIYLIERAAPQTQDNWQIYYDYRPYQGLGKVDQCFNPDLSLLRHQFLIKSDGQMIVNTRGSGACECGCETPVPEGCTLFC